MKALVLQKDPAEKLVLKDVDLPELQSGEVLIRMKTAALNHRDQWCRVGMYPGLTYPSILGSDGCGIVEQVHNDEDEHWLKEEVIINPNIDWGEHPEVQSIQYHILGMPQNGTIAEYLIVPSHRLHKKPEHLKDEEAAAIPLAGLTAYRAVFRKGQVQANKKVLITGIGGGVALFALQFAVAAGAQVFVTSGSEEKLQKAQELGATFGINYKTEAWFKQLRPHVPLGFDTIIDSAGGPDFGNVAKMMGPAANMVVYGTTAGMPSPLHLPRLFFTQGAIKGTTMGNDEEFAEMIQFIKEHQIRPVVSSVRPLEEAISAFDEMAAGKQFGKLVIRIQD